MSINSILQNLDIAALENELSALTTLINEDKYKEALPGLKHLNDVLRIPRGQIGYKFATEGTLTTEEWKIVDLKRDLDLNLGLCYFYLNDFITSAFYNFPYSTMHAVGFIGWIQAFTSTLTVEALDILQYYREDPGRLDSMFENDDDPESSRKIATAAVEREYAWLLTEIGRYHKADGKENIPTAGTDIASIREALDRLNSMVSERLYDDALPILLKMHNILKIRCILGKIGASEVYSNELPELLEVEQEIEWLLGYCYYFLEDYINTSFYFHSHWSELSQWFIGWIKSYTRAFATNALCFLYGLIALPEEINTRFEKENDPGQSRRLAKATVERDYSWLLIEYKCYDEAHRLLESMLSDEINKEYAESELEYLESQQKQEN